MRDRAESSRAPLRGGPNASSSHNLVALRLNQDSFWKRKSLQKRSRTLWLVSKCQCMTQCLCNVVMLSALHDRQRYMSRMIAAQCARLKSHIRKCGERSSAWIRDSAARCLLAVKPTAECYLALSRASTPTYQELPDGSSSCSSSCRLHLLGLHFDPSSRCSFEIVDLYRSTMPSTKNVVLADVPHRRQVLDTHFRMCLPHRGRAADGRRDR